LFSGKSKIFLAAKTRGENFGKKESKSKESKEEEKINFLPLGAFFIQFSFIFFILSWHD
jgi:hypothetical protein